jgi:molybdate transport system ATP-binding protein
MGLEVRLQHRFAAFELDVAFRAERGTVTALFGPSGAGKSSIVHALAGLLRPDKGRVLFDDEALFDSETGIFVAPERRRAGLMFQDARLFPHMRVKDNLLFGWRRAGRKAPPGEIERLISLLGLGPLLERRPRHLSGGEKSRVALGRALLSGPRFLMLDEPLAALDAARRAEILPWLERLRDMADMPILYVSHAAEEVARLADQVILLRAGKITARGPAAAVLSEGGFFGALLETRVLGQRTDGLTELGFDGGTLAIAAKAAPGTRLRVRIAPEDVLLSRDPPGPISANNVMAAKVASVEVDGAVARIRLSVGRAELFASITAASAARLALTPEMVVYAIVKSVAVDRRRDENI